VEKGVLSDSMAAVADDPEFPRSQNGQREEEKRVWEKEEKKRGGRRGDPSRNFLPKHPWVLSEVSATSRVPEREKSKGKIVKQRGGGVRDRHTTGVSVYASVSDIHSITGDRREKQKGGTSEREVIGS